MTRAHFISSIVQIPSGERYLALCGEFVPNAHWIAEIDLRELGTIPTMGMICGKCFAALSSIPSSWHYVYAACDGERIRHADE